jgi:hypothetical protein
MDVDLVSESVFPFVTSVSGELTITLHGDGDFDPFPALMSIGYIRVIGLGEGATLTLPVTSATTLEISAVSSPGRVGPGADTVMFPFLETVEVLRVHNSTIASLRDSFSSLKAANEIWIADNGVLTELPRWTTVPTIVGGPGQVTVANNPILCDHERHVFYFLLVGSTPEQGTSGITCNPCEVSDFLLTCEFSNCYVPTCVPETGCSIRQSTASCDDGNLCTFNDRCVKFRHELHCISPRSMMLHQPTSIINANGGLQVP